MDFAPIPRVAVSDQVLARLIDEILSGRLAQGRSLPAERELAEKFEVNRHAVREALKSLKQAGLVRISQGGKTRVLDWRTHAGPDVLIALAGVGTVPPLRVLRDVAQLRRVIGSDAAALCATRGGDGGLAAVTAAAEAFGTGEASVSETFAADTDLWNAIIDGSRNLAYRLSFNTLLASFRAVGNHALLELGMAAELADRDAHRELAGRIAARDGEGARRLADELLGRIVLALNEARGAAAPPP